MYKTTRDTSMWFDNDYRGNSQDRILLRDLAPGSY